MEKINKIKTVIASAILAGGLILGGQAIHKIEIRNARMSLLEQRDFSRNNPNLCKIPEEFDKDFVMDERCLTFQEFQLLNREIEKVKKVKVKGKPRSVEDILDDKLLK